MTTPTFATTTTTQILGLRKRGFGFEERTERTRTKVREKKEDGKK